MTLDDSICDSFVIIASWDGLNVISLLHFSSFFSSLIPFDDITEYQELLGQNLRAEPVLIQLMKDA